MSDRHRFVGYIFASPWLIGFFLLMLFPMIASLLLSMVRWNVSTGLRFSRDTRTRNS